MNGSPDNQELRKMELFSKQRLKNSRCGATVKTLGVETHVASGSRSVNSAHDSRNSYYSGALYFADLRELACVSMPGTARNVFLTPDQARFFCARRKAQEEHNINDRIRGGQRRCAHELYPRPARRSFSRSAKPQTICTASHALFTAGAAGNQTPSPASKSPDGSSTAAPILTPSSRRGEL